MDSRKKVYLRGNKDYAAGIIGYLETLGGKNEHGIVADNPDYIYTIRFDDVIVLYVATEDIAKVVMDNYKEIDIKDIVEPDTEPWEYDNKADIHGYYIKPNSIVAEVGEGEKNNVYNRNVFATEAQARSALAMAQISQIMVNDVERYGGVITDDEWENGGMFFYIYRYGNRVYVSSQAVGSYAFLAFRKKAHAERFMKEHDDLVKDYLMVE